MLLIILVACSFSSKDAEKFVLTEQSSVTRKDYEEFLLGNLDIIQENLRETFISRLGFKAEKISNEVIMIDMVVGENEGMAIFSVKGKWEYKLVTFSYSEEGITNYRIKTVYGVK